MHYHLMTCQFKLLLFLLPLFCLSYGVTSLRQQSPQVAVYHLLLLQLSLSAEIFVELVIPLQPGLPPFKSALEVHLYHSPSHVVLLYPPYITVTLQPSVLRLQRSFHHLHCSFDPLLFILFALVTPHIHRNILISATFNLFSCPLFNAHVPARTATLVNDGLISFSFFSCTDVCSA